MIQQNLVKALIGLVLLMIAMAILGVVYEEEMTQVTTWIVKRVGFAGLAALLMVTDTFVTPFPPDILLVVIAKSPLSEEWAVYVGVLGLVSVVAGMTGYGIGRWLGHFRWCRRLFGDFKDDHGQFIRKFGFWGVALGAMTPLPYSVTCWTAGALGLRWTTVFLATVLFRIPRFYLYYVLLSTSGNLFSLGG